MSDETPIKTDATPPEPSVPSVREMAAAIVALGIQGMEAQLYQAQIQVQMLQTQIQAARIRAPLEVDRLAREMHAGLSEPAPE